MQTTSFLCLEDRILSLTVDVILAPGLPQIVFLGQPDRVLRESALRIKLALRAAGFNFPTSQQVIVDVGPRGCVKRARGLDLPVAVAFLLESGQMNCEVEPWAPVAGANVRQPHIYGDLALNGSVQAPEDIQRVLSQSGFSLLTGAGLPAAIHQRGADDAIYCVTHLREVAAPERAECLEIKELGPSVKERKSDEEIPLLTSDQRTLLKLIALGEHPTLFAGSAGSGKTTTAKLIHAFRRPLTREEIARLGARGWSERPCLQPHHTASPLAVVGGGRPIRPGALAEADSGTIIFDELLEFHPQVQEALREPMEAGWIELHRGSNWKKLRSEALILATTNLCPCGGATAASSRRCRCSSRHRSNYGAKLSGPIVDRFQMVIHSDDWKRQKALPFSSRDAADVRAELLGARDFIQRTRGSDLPLASRMTEKDLVAMTERSVKVEEFLEPEISLRRRIHLWRIARTLADLEESEVIGRDNFLRAVAWAIDGHQRLQI